MAESDRPGVGSSGWLAASPDRNDKDSEANTKNTKNTGDSPSDAIRGALLPAARTQPAAEHSPTCGATAAVLRLRRSADWPTAPPGPPPPPVANCSTHVHVRADEHEWAFRSACLSTLDSRRTTSSARGSLVSKGELPGAAPSIAAHSACRTVFALTNAHADGSCGVALGLRQVLGLLLRDAPATERASYSMALRCGRSNASSMICEERGKMEVGVPDVASQPVRREPDARKCMVGHAWRTDEARPSTAMGSVPHRTAAHVGRVARPLAAV